MRNSVILISLAIMAMLAFNSCKKDYEMATPRNKTITKPVTTSTKTFSVMYNPTKLKSTVNGIAIDSGSTINIATTGNMAFWTFPVTLCNWTLNGVLIATNIDQALFNLATDKTKYCITATKVGTTETTIFYINVNSDSAKVVTPVVTPIAGATTLMRLLKVQDATSEWLLTFRVGKQSTATGYNYYSNWNGNYQTLNSYDIATVIGSDSIDVAYYLPKTGLASTRRTFIVTTNNGQWFNAKSTACRFYDPNYFASGGTTADNVFSFYLDPTTGTVYDVNQTAVLPGQVGTPIVDVTPGTLGDTVGAVNTTSFINGNLVIYVKMPPNSTVVVQTSATAATSPTAAWSSYLQTTAVAGTTTWSYVTILATDLKKYNWWMYGTGNSTNYTSSATMNQSSFYIKGTGACRLITTGN